MSDSHFIYQLSSIAIMNRCGARASLGLCRQRLASSPTAAARLYSSATVKIEKTGEPVKVALIPSDGVGKEVVPEARRVLEAVEPHLPFAFSWVPLHAGWETFQQQGVSLPKETIEGLKGCDGALFGAVSSPSHKVEGYSSPIIGMRKALDLYANLRPVISAPIKTSRPDIDMLIVRENTECLYVKKERMENGPQGRVAIADRVISEYASTRIAQMAFSQAERRAAVRAGSKRPARVTVVHKSNVLSVTDGLFRECALEVAKKYPHIEVEEQLVDSMVYKMILDPQRYDVVVAPNLYGDILSDAAAALVGGLGLAPSANVSDSFALCEPVHGSAPDIAGKGIVNPLATIRAAALLLRHLRGPHADAAAQMGDVIEEAVNRALAAGPLTPDMGGKASTTQVTDAVIEHLKSLLLNKH